MKFQCYNNKNTELSKKKLIKQVKAMNGVYMTRAEKMMFGYNQDGDTNGKSLKERDIYMSIMLSSWL